MIPNGSIAYRERGVGPTLALLHAFPLSSALFEPQLAALADACHVVALDLRGFGQTPLEGPYSLEELAQDVAQTLAALGHERFVLGGLSMGGYVALAFQRLFGDRLQGLILADTRAGADSPEARERRLAIAREVEERGTEGLVETMPDTLLSAGAAPDLKAHVRRWIAQADPRAVAAAQRAMAARLDSTPLLAAVRVPALVVVGEQDALVSPAEAEQMASMLPNGRLVRIPRAGHLSNVENPVAFNTALREFMRAIVP